MRAKYKQRSMDKHEVLTSEKLNGMTKKLSNLTRYEKDRKHTYVADGNH